MDEIRWMEMNCFMKNSMFLLTPVAILCKFVYTGISASKFHLWEKHAEMEIHIFQYFIQKLIFLKKKTHITTFKNTDITQSTICFPNEMNSKPKISNAKHNFAQQCTIIGKIISKFSCRNNMNSSICFFFAARYNNIVKTSFFSRKLELNITHYDWISTNFDNWHHFLLHIANAFEKYSGCSILFNLHKETLKAKYDQIRTQKCVRTNEGRTLLPLAIKWKTIEFYVDTVLVCAVRPKFKICVYEFFESFSQSYLER